MSVSLVQHYFGDKANLLQTTLEIQSEAMNAHIASKLAELGDTPSRSPCCAPWPSSFLPLDDVSRRSMLVYQGFAAAALTDDTLRSSEMFANGRQLIDFFADQLTQLRGNESHADEDATGLLSLVLGLSMSVLLDQITPTEATAVLDRHLDRITG